MKTLIFRLFALVSAMLLLVACSNNDASTDGEEKSDGNVEKQKIILSHDVPDTHIKNKASEVLKEYVEEASNGNIQIEIYGNNTLFDTANQYQNLASNNTQFIISDMSRMVDVHPAFNIPSLPFIFDNNESSMEFWSSETGKEILKSFEKDGIIGLAIWPNGEKHIMTRGQDVRHPDDLKGLKLRVQGGDILNETYSTLNANSMSLGIDELYTSIETGVVDGLENTFGALESFNFDEVTDYLTMTGHNRIDYVLQTNLEFWESLDDETRKIIEEGVEEATKFANEQTEKLNNESLEKLRDRGQVEIIELTEEEKDAFKDALKPLYDKWVPIIGEEYIDKINEINNGK